MSAWHIQGHLNAQAIGWRVVSSDSRAQEVSLGGSASGIKLVLAPDARTYSDVSPHPLPIIPLQLRAFAPRHRCLSPDPDFPSPHTPTSSPWAFVLPLEHSLRPSWIYPLDTSAPGCGRTSLPRFPHPGTTLERISSRVLLWCGPCGKTISYRGDNNTSSSGLLMNSTCHEVAHLRNLCLWRRTTTR